MRTLWSEEDRTRCEMVLENQEKAVVKDMRVQLTRTCVTPYEQDRWIYSLLGIGKNATGSNPLPWARRAVLVRVPGDI